jgi:hypothetical protein
MTGGGRMPKRRFILDERRDVRERVFRQIKAELDLYWSMCSTLATADQFDATLAMRMLRHRERVLRLVECLMPEPREGELLDAGDAPDQSRSVH